MVAHLLRLKLTLLRNGLRRSPWQLVGMAFAGLYALGLVATLVVVLVLLRNKPDDLAHTVVVLVGSAAILGWGIVPVIASATDMTLDPARFTTFAIPMKQMLAGLALGGLIGIPGVATSLVALSTVATWSRGVLPALAAFVGAVLGVLTCVVLAKVVTTATASLAASRRFKDVSAIAFMVPLVLMGPIVAGVGQGISSSSGFLPGFVRMLSWTPLGAPWSIAGDVAAGRPGAAALKLLLSVAVLAVLAWAWKVLLERALVTPPYAGSGKRKGGRLGLLGLLPATPAGAVMARSLTYWFRDPRYSGSLVVIPLLPVVLVFQGSQTGDYTSLGFLAPLSAFILAWSISADVSYDNTAFALHLSLGILFTGLGLSSIVSARYTVAVPLPGDSPFKKPPGNVGQTLAVQFGGLLILMVLVLPEVGLLVAQLVTGNSLFGWINLLAGTGLGVGLFVAGIRLGGKWLDARGPELLAQVSVNR
jgi:ABC-2 type transport system permease protein